MALREELKEYVENTLRFQWKTRNGNVVPDPEDLPLDNTAVRFDRATVLYADLAWSTKMVDRYKWHLSGEIYKSYLYCASRIIRNEGGEITAYDGDRVMGIFVGDLQSSNAAKCVLKINYVVHQIVNPLSRLNTVPLSFLSHNASELIRVTSMPQELEFAATTISSGLEEHRITPPSSPNFPLTDQLGSPTQSSIGCRRKRNIPTIRRCGRKGFGRLWETRQSISPHGGGRFELCLENTSIIHSTVE